MKDNNSSCCVALDERQIKSIWWGDGGFTIGVDGITKITPYQEAGQNNYITWVAIYKGDFLYARADVSGSLITYQKAGQ